MGIPQLPEVAGPLGQIRTAKHLITNHRQVKKPHLLLVLTSFVSAYSFSGLMICD